MNSESIGSLSTPKLNIACDPEMLGLLPCKEVEDHDNIDKVGGAWAVLDGKTMLLKDFKGVEEALLAETSDAEALEPQMLTEEK